MSIDSREPVWSDAAIKCEGQDAQIDITATHHDGADESTLEVCAYNEAVTLWLGLSPQRARQFAEDLILAAHHTERGDA